MHRIVYLNGSFVLESAARISIYDSALTMGDMAFEVTRTFNQRPFRLRQHLQRLFHTLSVIRVNSHLSIEELESLTEQTLARNLPTELSDVDWNIIHNISAGPATSFLEAFAADEIRPTVIISCFPLTRKLGELAPLYQTGIDLISPQQAAIPSELLNPNVKTRSRMHYHLANMQAHDQFHGAWAILTTPNGKVTEGTSGNLFLIRGDKLITPSSQDVLEGVTRGLVLELAEQLGISTMERDVFMDDMLTAQESFLTSTSIGIIHNRSFNGHAFGDGRIGPVTARLRKALHRVANIDFAEQAAHYAQRMLADRS